MLIPPPAGPPHPLDGPLPRPELEGAKAGVLTTAVRTFALENGMADGWFHGTEGPLRTTLIAVRMPDQATALGLAGAYLDDQKGLSTLDELSYQGVEVVSSGTTFRTAYVAHAWAIIVDVHAVEGPGQAARDLFRGLLERQLAKTPPTVRDQDVRPSPEADTLSPRHPLLRRLAVRGVQQRFQRRP